MDEVTKVLCVTQETLMKLGQPGNGLPSPTASTDTETVGEPCDANAQLKARWNTATFTKMAQVPVSNILKP